MVERKEDLWAKSIRAKYKCGNDILPKINRNLFGSNFWKGVCKSWPEVEKNLAWRVGNGKMISCWNDVWVPKVGTLRDLALRPLNEADFFKKVSSWGTVSGAWDLDGIGDVLPHYTVLRIMSLPGPCAGRGEDRAAWRCTADGCFSNASAYESLLDPSLKIIGMPFKWIWSWKCPERVRMHLWKIAHQALITNVWREKRHLVDSNLCPVCGLEEESVVHVVRDCSRMVQVWMAICDGILPHNSFFTEDLGQWLSSNLKSLANRRSLSWPLLFGTTVHLAWQARNELIFHQKSLSIDQLVRRILCQTNAINTSLIDHERVNPAGRKGEANEIRWGKPKEGWCKLNCDGAVSNYGNTAGCGGVIRDDNGCFLIGFAAGLGACSITEAELWAICKGIQLVKDRGIQQIAIETDSLVARNLITGDCSSLHPCFNLVKEIRDLLESQRRFSVFTSLPSFGSVAYAADCNGVIFPRGF